MGEDRRDGDGTVLLLIKGALIGIANIIPGVSGGTFALVLGIYDRLIAALRSIGGGTIKTSLKLLVGPHKPAARAAFVEEMRRIDMWFLGCLGLGAGVSIMGSSFAIGWLLENEPGITLAFFLGLIIPSIAVPWRMMEKRTVGALLWIIPGMAVTVGLSLAFSSDAEGSDNPVMVFLAGAAAISAMILPGISGSFLMLVIGQYQNVLAALQNLQVGSNDQRIDAIIYLALLAMGCVVGLLAFARLLDWVLKRFRSATLAFLIGLVLGSFYVMWPFKDYDSGAQVQGRDGETKTEIQIATAPNRLPSLSADGAEIGKDSLAFVVGLVGAAGVEWVGGRNKKKKKGSGDESDEER
jgi:putative membrane protein